MTKELLIETENRIKKYWEDGDIPYLCHLCGGNEEYLLDYYENNFTKGDYVLCSHRCHYHALLYGIEPDDLVGRVLAGKSMFIYDDRFLCSAIVAGVCSIACGIALGIQNQKRTEKVHCFVGDGATDEGSFWEAARFAAKRELPLTFIVENNGAQCGVDSETRWGCDELENELKFYQPNVVCYRYEPTYPHAGTLGPDGKPTRPKLK